MCHVTDKQKKDIGDRIETLKGEKASNQAVIDDATESKKENEDAIAQCDCATEALGKMELGGNDILTATKGCINEINARMKMMDTIIEEATAIQEQIETKLEAEEKALADVPENCGTCWECDPPPIVRFFGGN